MSTFTDCLVKKRTGTQTRNEKKLTIRTQIKVVKKRRQGNRKTAIQMPKEGTLDK
jgi:hypothetical protein